MLRLTGDAAERALVGDAAERVGANGLGGIALGDDRQPPLVRNLPNRDERVGRHVVGVVRRPGDAARERDQPIERPLAGFGIRVGACEAAEDVGIDRANDRGATHPSVRIRFG